MQSGCHQTMSLAWVVELQASPHGLILGLPGLAFLEQ